MQLLFDIFIRALRRAGLAPTGPKIIEQPHLATEVARGHRDRAQPLRHGAFLLELLGWTVETGGGEFGRTPAGVRPPPADRLDPTVTDPSVD